MNEEQMSNAVSDIAADIGLGGNTETEETTETTTEETVDTSAATNDTTGGETAQPSAETVTAPRPAPKSWAKEQHERWGKLDKDTQDYIELREKQALDGITQYSEKAKRAEEWDTAVKDYMPLIQEQGITAPAAVKYLFEAHRQLSSGTPEQRAAYLQKVADSYGIKLGAQAAGADEPAYVKELRQELAQLKGTVTSSQQAALNEQRTKISNEVNTFADAKDEKGNPKHPYFDECAPHIAALIQAGHSLPDAYDQAVWANPVTRAKEQERLKTEDQAALRAKAKEEAEKSRRASSTNVHSRDTRRSPTAPKAANWEEGLHQTLKEIKERTH